MKATGIVRRIDDLGRVVIPKEIRRTMRIRDGDPLEIYTDRDGEVIFKKYSPMGELGAFAAQLCETLYKTAGIPAVITDRDAVIGVAGVSKRDVMERRLSTALEDMMEQRRTYRLSPGETAMPALDGDDRYSVLVASPILAEGDVSGCVLFLKTDTTEEATETEFKLVQTISGFLGRQMES